MYSIPITCRKCHVEWSVQLSDKMVHLMFECPTCGKVWEFSKVKLGDVEPLNCGGEEDQNG